MEKEGGVQAGMVIEISAAAIAREEARKRIIYACWAYKRGGGHFSSAYKKRYFVITADRLNYYEDPEQYYQNREKGTLSCIGMLIRRDYIVDEDNKVVALAKEYHGQETIEGNECFTFTLQAKEGSRTSDIKCACETNDEREQLLVTLIEKGACLDGGHKVFNVNGHVVWALGKAFLQAAATGNKAEVRVLASANSSATHALESNFGPLLEFRDAKGYTPLIHASVNGHQEVAAVLLQHRADTDAKDNNGKTALQHAEEKRRHDIVALLKFFIEH